MGADEFLGVDAREKGCLAGGGLGDAGHPHHGICGDEDPIVEKKRSFSIREMRPPEDVFEERAHRVDVGVVRTEAQTIDKEEDQLFQMGSAAEKAGAAFLDNLDEVADASVISGLDVIREIAGRQFSVTPVAGQAFAADPLTSAGIGAIAHRLILINGAAAHYSSSMQSACESYLPWTASAHNDCTFINEEDGLCKRRPCARPLTRLSMGPLCRGVDLWKTASGGELCRKP